GARSEMGRAAVGPARYMVPFPTRDDADRRVARAVRGVLEVLMRRGIKPTDIDVSGGIRNLAPLVEEGRALGEPLMAPAELDVFVRAYERTGFTGGGNRDPNIGRNSGVPPRPPHGL